MYAYVFFECFGNVHNVMAMYTQLHEHISDFERLYLSVFTPFSPVRNKRSQRLILTPLKKEFGYCELCGIGHPDWAEYSI